MKRVTVILVLLFHFQTIFNQTLEFTQIPAWTSTQNLNGNVHNTIIASNKILAYNYVEGWWYLKPYESAPFTTINPDSTWTCDVTTGGNDKYASRLIAFIVPVGFTIPGFSFQTDLPDILYSYPNNLICRKPGNRIISFADYQWIVKQSEAMLGPGPNFWNDDTTNVFVDSIGRLHLKIKHINNIWYCAEVVADTSFGYGCYTFDIESSLDNIDKNAVLGCFTWDEYGNNDYYREIDFEASRWGDELNSNFQYVVQPWYVPENIFRFNTTPDKNTIHSFTWKKDTIIFESHKPDNSSINSWFYTGDYLTHPGNENVRLNTWLFNNNGLSTGEEIEIIFNRFEFQEILTAPQLITASDGTDSSAVIVSWQPVSSANYYMVYRNIENSPVKAIKLFSSWIHSTTFLDTTAVPGQVYYYWVRASDNSNGSNTGGYASGFSQTDAGWRPSTSSGDKNPICDYIKMFPNPTKSETRTINIINDGVFKNSYTINISDTSGRKISQYDVNSNQKTLSLPFLAPGIYNLVFKDDNLSCQLKLTIAE